MDYSVEQVTIPKAENKKKPDLVQTAPPPAPVKARRKRSKKRKSKGNVFDSALAAAEQQLAQAIVERDKAGATWAYHNAMIPSLVTTINALKNQQNPQPTNYPAQPRIPVTIEQIMSDAPIQAPPQIPQVAVPQINPRGGGGTMGIELPAELDENAFLDETRSDITGGRGWV